MTHPSLEIVHGSPFAIRHDGALLPSVTGASHCIDAGCSIVDCCRDGASQQDDREHQCRADDRQDDHILRRRSAALIHPEAAQDARRSLHAQIHSCRCHVMAGLPKPMRSRLAINNKSHMGLMRGALA